MTRAADRPLLPALFAMTFVTGVVDAVSYLGLGHVFTANMTGNVVLLGFAVAGTSGFSIGLSLTALLGFMAGAVAGGRLGLRRGEDRHRWLLVAIAIELGFTAAATLISIGVHPDDRALATYATIVVLAVGMGLRNATVRRLAVPDMTTTVLTMTITGLAAESAPGSGERRRTVRRVGSIALMGLGALVGALLVRTSVAAALALAVAALLATAAVHLAQRPAAAPTA